MKDTKGRKLSIGDQVVYIREKDDPVDFNKSTYDLVEGEIVDIHGNMARINNSYGYWVKPKWIYKKGVLNDG